MLCIRLMYSFRSYRLYIKKRKAEISVFKSYLRRLLQDLKDLREALKNKEYEKAEEMTEKLIDDTQKGIEDN